MVGNKPKVTILGINYSPEPTGIAPYTAGLAVGLSKRGYAVNVVTGYPHYPAWKISDGYEGSAITEIVDGVEIKRLKHYVPTRPSTKGRIRLEASFGARLLRTSWHHPDVIVCVTPALLATAAALIRARVARYRPAVGVWVQDLYGLGVVETGAMTGRAADATSALESYVLRNADGVAVIHKRFKDHVVTKLGVDDGRATVIRNWSHLVTHRLENRSGIRSRNGWESGQTIVLHAGNMGAKQGLESVVETAKLAQVKAPHVKFVLLGDGNQRAYVERQAAGCANIEFVSPLPEREFSEALQAADILLVNERASLSEMAVPSKLTSYFASGRPVLAATSEDSVTYGEISTSGAGLCVKPEDPEALLAGVLQLSADEAFADQLGAAGVRFRAENLTIDRALDDFERWVLKLNSDRQCSERRAA